MLPGICLGVAVWGGACPAFSAGEPMPVPAIVGCPVPVAGLIYDLDHAEVDRDATMALDRARVELDAARVVLSQVDEQWSPAVWFGLGVAGGVLGAVLYAKGAE